MDLQPGPLELIDGLEVDRLLRWRAGRAQKLALRGKLPHYRLPDGAVRFRRDEVLALVRQVGIDEERAPQAEGRP